MPRLGPGPTSGGGESSAIPSGEYIIALRSFQRKTSQRKKEYLRCRFVVCSGQLKGRAFFVTMSLDLSVEGTKNRWLIWIDALGITEEFELGDGREGTAREGDENIRRLFVGQPFKATIKAEVNGQYTNNDIQYFTFKSKWTQQDLAEMSAWLEEEEKRAAGRGSDSGGSGGGPEDDYEPGPSGGPVVDDDDYYAPGGGTKAGGYAGDDDIPF